MNKILPFMTLPGEQKHITENYVSVPPALTITDEAGSIWTLGFKFGPISGGEFTFNVLKDGIDTGEYANRIERRKNEIWLFTSIGWKRMPVIKREAIQVYAVGARANSKKESITVKIYWDSFPDVAVISFNFNPSIGGLHDLTKSPLVCLPNQWLHAIVEPTFETVEVSGYLGAKYIREIPILRRHSK